MISKIIIKDKQPKNLKGKDITYNVTESKYIIAQYVNEPISGNICNAINDCYNLMHLIKNSWSNKKYTLKMEEVGYNMYDENNNLEAWIGVKEKRECIMFIIFSWGRLYNNAYKFYKKSKNRLMMIFDSDEDMWIYSKLNINDILKKKNYSSQKKIIKEWIKVNIEKIL
jgi:hypothetical protein